jgi:5-methylcytosine-specific restriction endonuclease McrA
MFRLFLCRQLACQLTDLCRQTAALRLFRIIELLSLAACSSHDAQNLSDYANSARNCSRGGKDTWENLVWASKAVNSRKADRLPHEAGLRLLKAPRAPKELPASATIRNAHRVPDWKLFVEE